MKARNAEAGYSRDCSRDDLLQDFLDSASLEFSESTGEPVPILEWVKGLTLGSRAFQVEGHEFELELLTEEAPRQCYKKGAQIGITETQILKTMHGLIYSRYPQGVLYLFPTVNDVTDFSRGRFGPLLADNPEIENQVSSTDAVGVKRIRRSMLYLRGARATGRIEGVKRTSSQLKSVPVDRVVFDEVDEMEAAMVDLALERMAHSTAKEEAYLSTPSIPDFGIDKLYNQSDQRVWMLRCEACGTET
jgi:phage terminase large subunit GpA-like protein